MTNNIFENGNNLSLSQATLYDRQIRLWGLEAQQLLMNGSVLIIGLSALSAEVLKNLVLAGVQNLHITEALESSDMEPDTCIVKKDDILNGTNFIYTKSSENIKKTTVFKEKIQSLNEHAQVEIIQANFRSLEHLKRYQIVCYFGKDIKEAISINKKCRKMKVGFMYGGCYGFYGFLFTDFGDHCYKKKAKDLNNEEIILTENIQYVELEEALEKHLTLNTKKGLKIKQLSNMMLMLCALYTNIQERALIKERMRQSWDRIYTLCIKNTKGNNPKFYIQKNLESLNTEVLSKIQNNADFIVEDELSACSSVIGGLISQEVTKLLTSFDEPINNFLCYDGINADAISHTLNKQS